MKVRFTITLPNSATYSEVIEVPDNLSDSALYSLLPMWTQQNFAESWEKVEESPESDIEEARNRGRG